MAVRTQRSGPRCYQARPTECFLTAHVSPLPLSLLYSSLLLNHLFISLRSHTTLLILTLPHPSKFTSLPSFQASTSPPLPFCKMQLKPQAGHTMASSPLDSGCTCTVVPGASPLQRGPGWQVWHLNCLVPGIPFALSVTHLHPHTHSLVSFI